MLYAAWRKRLAAERFGAAVVVGVAVMAQSGITCRDVESGHGFSISREAYRLF
jgi:hypothetical protein